MAHRIISMLSLLDEQGYTIRDLIELLDTVCEIPLQEIRMESKTLSVEQKIKKILKELCISPNLLGYRYIKIGILFALEDPTLLDSLCQRFYPKIAEANQTTVSKVERAIRHAIDRAFYPVKSKGNQKKLGKYFSDDKPTNGEFFAIMVEYLQDN